jgi:predicted transcriptional regulator
MNLQNLRDRLSAAIEKSELGQDGFARKYDLSSSYVNKFLRGELLNPRLKSMERIESAIATESRSNRRRRLSARS